MEFQIMRKSFSSALDSQIPPVDIEIGKFSLSPTARGEMKVKSASTLPPLSQLLPSSEPTRVEIEIIIYDVKMGKIQRAATIVIRIRAAKHRNANLEAARNKLDAAFVIIIINAAFYEFYIILHRSLLVGRLKPIC
jgi:hypothetical protein